MTSVSHLLLLAATLAAGDANARDCVSDAREVAQLAVATARDISSKGAQGFLRHLPAEGLYCGDGVFSRAEVEQQLRTPGEWLNALVDNAPELARMCPKQFPDRPLSDALTASEWRSLFIDLDIGLGTAHVFYVAESGVLRAILDFERVNRRWCIQGDALCGPSCFHRDGYRQTDADRMGEEVRTALKARGAKGEFSSVCHFASYGELRKVCPSIGRAIRPFDGEAWLGVMGNVSENGSLKWVLLDNSGESMGGGSSDANAKQ